MSIVVSSVVRTPRRPAIRAFLLVAAFASAIACGGGGDATSPGGGGGGGGGGGTGTSGSVEASGMTFSPASVTIKAGGTVTWTFKEQHTVTFTSTTKPTNGDIAATSTGSVSRTFPSAGTYTYYCTIHGSTMSGTVVVQ